MKLHRLLLVLLVALNVDAHYDVGLGIHDVTGPVAGINMMGYAMIKQITQGIQSRLRARCFIFVTQDKPNPGSGSARRLVYCSVDISTMSPLVKTGVIETLAKLYGPGVYTKQNVMLSATHTHASPDGFHEYFLYSFTTRGFIKESAQALIYGIVEAIRRAHKNIRPGVLTVRRGELRNANINRSPSAYAANPEELKQRYAEHGDTDKTMTLIKIRGEDGDLRGLLNFFSVHCTSFNNTNKLVTADHKGYASWLMERDLNQIVNGLHLTRPQPYTSPEVRDLIDRGKFVVAAFGETQAGDVSPNLDGPFCIDTGLPCDYLTSTCPNRRGRPSSSLCVSRGPGFSVGGQEEGARIIGFRQYLRSRYLLETGPDEMPLQGELDYAHAWINMANTTVKFDDGTTLKTCLPARGYSFAAGTTDGAGLSVFRQGDNSTGTPFFNTIRSILSRPSKEQRKCHYPKPILLNTGKMKFPYSWEPEIVDIQIFRLGDLILLGVPAEFSTMAGRLLREAVQKVFVDAGIVNPSQIFTLVSGISNSYSGYVTTFEEYQVQRYEGASCIYGPHALSAYIQEFVRLARTMVPETVQFDALPDPAQKPSLPPLDFSDKLITVLPPVLFDAVPPGRKFGQVVPGKDVNTTHVYNLGETVEATFYSGHPRNVASDPALQLEGTFAGVEKFTGPSVERIMQEVQSLYGRTNYSDVRFAAINDTILSIQIPQFTEPLYVMQRAHDASVELTSRIPTSTEAYKRMWLSVRDDDDWDLKFHWSKPIKIISPLSYARVEWRITERPDHDMVRTRELFANSEDWFVQDWKAERWQKSDEVFLRVEGLYRLRYFGAHKQINGKIRLHQGQSSVFAVGKAYTLDASMFN